jgi:uncharacterized membrane protein YdjX (TVP38/TMEM64 family)
MKWQIAFLGALVLAGVALDVLGIVDWREVLAWARGHAGRWYVPVLIVAAQFVLFTFAQPGSVLFWVAALLYAPPAATAILVAGGTSGAAGAYLLARRLTRLDLAKAREQRVFRLLERRGDFFTLCALRVLPGMPNSLINYGAGVLALPLAMFLAATALGLAVKMYLYAAAVDAAVGSTTPRDLVRVEVLGPLVTIALLLAFGRPALEVIANRRAARRRAGKR